MKRLARDEKGQALIITLLLLVIGSIIITPTLNFMGTGIKAGRVYEQKIDEIYAADAGVEDAMWHIRYENVDDLLGANYTPYEYSSNYPYPYTLLVNGKNVTVTIQNIWIPSNIDVPTNPSVPQQSILDEKLLIIGYPSGTPSAYTIKIVYDWQSTDERDNLKITTIGVWLCPGFEYDGLLDGNQLPPGSPSPSVDLYKGGSAVVWDFGSGTALTNFPTPATGTRSPMVKTITFKYKGPAGQIPELVSSWVDTTGIPNKPYSYTWDDSIRLYNIVSQAGDVEIQAYGAKTRFRRLKSAISGNYFSTGNSLIGGNLESPYNYHYQLYSSTQAVVPTNDNDPTQGIPSDATFEKAYLYWTGWIDWNTYTPPASGDQTRYPSGDISRYGTWDKTTSMYSYVDEQGAHDGDTSYLLHGTTAGYVYFSFPAFSVPALQPGEQIRGLTVSLVARDNTLGGNNMRPTIRVGGTNYPDISTSQEVQPSYSTISYTYRTNPRTNKPWTVSDINGVGSNPLQGFGVRSTDANPSIRLTQVYARVEWGLTLRYPADPTEEELRILIEDLTRVNKGLFNNVEVTADNWQIVYPANVYDGSVLEGTWLYTCKFDVTDLLQQWIDDEIIASNGAGTYTFGHVAASNQEYPPYSFSFVGGGSTGYPLGIPSPNPNPTPDPNRYTAAHAGWSLLIQYTSTGTLRNQFYLYDIDTPGFNFFYNWQDSNFDWDNDGNPGGTITGFLVPPQTPGETLAARVTVFVGEGDKGFTGDYFKVETVALVDGTGYPTNNVWNSNSRGLTVEGVDIDHFDITWASNILRPYDTSAWIEVPTGGDGFSMSYMLLLFRSELGPGGVITNYAIKVL